MSGTPRCLLSVLGIIEASCLGCGGGFSDIDTRIATDSVLSAAAVEELCARGTDGGAEAGACEPSQVRAMTRETLCGAEALLVHHGKPLPDAGAAANAIMCAPESVSSSSSEKPCQH